MLGAYFHSFLIAKVLGFWMLILSITLAAKRSYFQKVMEKIGDEKVADFVYASMLTFIGLFLVFIHNIWFWDVVLLVTLACWAILIKGILWLGFPEWLSKISKNIVSTPWYWVMVGFGFIYAVLLLSYGAHFTVMYDGVPLPLTPQIVQ